MTEYISKKTGVPCTLENDGNAAAAAEYWVGSGKGYKSLVMLTLGSGVGCGFVEEGRILHGGFDMGAETGHMIVEKDGRKCGCGQKGCLETVYLYLYLYIVYICKCCSKSSKRKIRINQNTIRFKKYQRNYLQRCI